MTNARLASVSIADQVIFLRTKRKNAVWGNMWQLYKPKLRVKRLRVIRVREVCESMRFDSGPEVFVLVNRNYVLTEYVLNDNDCSTVNYNLGGPPPGFCVARYYIFSSFFLSVCLKVALSLLQTWLSVFYWYYMYHTYLYVLHVLYSCTNFTVVCGWLSWACNKYGMIAKPISRLLRYQLNR